MNRTHNPTSVAPPAGHFSHGVEVPPNARWLAISGQVGTAPDGTLPPQLEAQAENAWRNIAAILDAAGMTLGDLVKVTAYLTRREDIAAYRAVRDRILGELRPASTLVVVSALVRPEWLVEIEAIAARA
jgi:enamine deaminase RidA (YjgF/YER057c/UK114 family)